METAKPVDVDETIFAVGSTTKAQLCAAWAVYINSSVNMSTSKAEQIHWKTPLAQMIPETFVLPDPGHTLQVTIEDVLSHKSGMASHDWSYGWENTKTVRDVTRNMRHLPLKSPVRSEWSYCNTGYAVATYALEVVTGQELKEYLREHIWGTLGMQTTFGGIQEVEMKKKRENLATGYTYSNYPMDDDFEQDTFESSPPQDISPVSGAGYILSTASDSIKWLRCLLNGSGPLTNDMVQDLFTPRSTAPWSGLTVAPLEGGHVQYALGWLVGVLHGYKIVYHTGGCIGYGALAMLVPQSNWAAVMFGNESYTGFRMSGLLFELLEISLGIPPDERKAFKTVDDSILPRYKSIFPPRHEKLQKLFPRAPSTPTIPPSLPLSAYAGKYIHPGYGPLTITLNDEGSLHCEINDRTWSISINIQHVNAEHWLFEEVKGSRELIEAKTEIGVKGKVEKFGVVFGGVPNGYVWFDQQ